MITILVFIIAFIAGAFVGLSVSLEKGHKRIYKCKKQSDNSDWLCGDYCIGVACPHFRVCICRVRDKRMCNKRSM